MRFITAPFRAIAAPFKLALSGRRALRDRKATRRAELSARRFGRMSQRDQEEVNRTRKRLFG